MPYMGNVHGNSIIARPTADHALGSVFSEGLITDGAPLGRLVEFGRRQTDDDGRAAQDRSGAMGVNALSLLFSFLYSAISFLRRSAFSFPL